MKIAKYVLIVLLTNVVLLACSDGFGETDFINSSVASTDVSATFDVAQDNSGEVTITPMATGVVLYKVYFGDNTTEPAEVKIGNSVRHTYAEGSYQVKIVAVNAIGRETEAILPLEVSFKAPENLKVIITNDLSVSKKINVTATADFATTADVYFGETANEIPNTVTIGETISHIYSQTGTYTITVEVKGAGKKTTKYEQKVTVVALRQPTLVAPKPPIRTSQDVISIFSGVYSNLSGTNYNPDWGQGSQGSSFANFTLNNDEILQLIKLSYQGIQFEKGIDVSAMEYLHLDVWTTDVTSLEISLISLTNGIKRRIDFGFNSLRFLPKVVIVFGDEKQVVVLQSGYGAYRIASRIVAARGDVEHIVVLRKHGAKFASIGIEQIHSFDRISGGILNPILRDGCSRQTGYRQSIQRIHCPKIPISLLCL